MDATARPSSLRTLSPRSLLRFATGRSGRVFAVRCLGVVALFGFEITLARSLGVAGYGIFSFALTLAIIAAHLSPLGWLGASTRLVSSYISMAKYGHLKGSLIIAYAATGIGLIIALPVLTAVASGSGSPDGQTIVAGVLMMAVALAVLELHRHILRGLHAGDFGEALVILLLPALVTAVVWGGYARDPTVTAYTYALTSLGLALLSSVVIARRLPAPMWKAKAEFRTRDWSFMALAILVGSASTDLISRTSVIVLGALGADQDVGLYHAAARLALMNIFVLRALTPVAAPRFSELYSTGRLVELRAAYRRLCLLSFLGSLPVFILLSVFPKFMLGFFGAEFVDSEATLRVLSIGYVASAAAGPCGTALIMIGRERFYAGFTFAALLVSVAANYLLAQHMGALGAAIATAGVMTLNNALYVAVFLRATRQRAAASPV